MRRFLTPKWIVSHLFVLAMVVLMVGLGFWQLDRLDERRARNDELRVALDQPPADLDELRAEDAPDNRTTIVAGEYRDDDSFLVANRTFESQAGAWLVTPLELEDGRTVIISRGWVPRTWTAGNDPRVIDTPEGRIEVQGRVNRSVDGGRLATSSTAILAEVSRLDLDRVEELLGREVVDRWIQLEVQAPAAGELPVPVPAPALDEGPHLAYAFQWFFFAGGTVVAYTLILRRRSLELE